MASAAVQARQQFAAAVEVGSLCHRAAMAGAAGGLDIAIRQDRFLPGQSCLMSFRHFRRRPLTAMAHRTSPCRRRMWHQGVGTERLGHGSVAQAGLRNPLVACDAAVYHVHLRNPDLVDSGHDVSEQPLGFGACLRVADIVPLVAPPLAQRILHRRDGQDANKQDAGHCERHAQAPAYLAHFFRGDHDCLQGHTQDQPGPRKYVPTTVRTTATVMNQLITHHESGRARRYCAQRPICGGAR